MGNIVKPFKQQPSSFAYQPLTDPLISVEEENENLGVFSFAEWMKAKKKFKYDRVETRKNGSIRAFYKGYIDGTTFAPSRTKIGTPVSVIECVHDSSHALQEWMEEVKSLGKIVHPNLVKLLGYSCEDKKITLGFSLLAQRKFGPSHFGKLRSLLIHGFMFLSPEEEALPWEIRVKIAIGTAQGLAFLNSIKNSPLHQQLRMHNIMLDEQCNAKLFYLESNNQCLDETFVERTEYIPPECYMSGHSGIEIDVYIFGVILLELLTGSKDKSKFLNNQSSDYYAGSFLPDNYKIEEIIDPRLGSDHPVNAATQMCTLIQSCTKRDKKNRPLMQQVLDVLNYIADIKVLM